MNILFAMLFSFSIISFVMFLIMMTTFGGEYDSPHANLTSVFFIVWGITFWTAGILAILS